MDLHNSVRRSWGAGPLSWDQGLANEAQNWVNHLASTCTIVHGGMNDHGQNLYVKNQKPTAPCNGDTTCMAKASMNAYIQEPVNRGTTNHMTQVLWRSTQRVGCAQSSVARCGSYNNIYTACHYDPPGNINGRWDIGQCSQNCHPSF